MESTPVAISPHVRSSGYRVGGFALILLAVAGLAASNFTGWDWTSPAGLIAVAGLIALGIVFIGVALVAQIFESRDMAEIEALLGKAESRNREAMQFSEEVAIEFGWEEPRDGDH